MITALIMIKAQITLLLLFVVYRTVFRNGTSVVARRIYILSAPVLAILFSVLPDMTTPTTGQMIALPEWNVKMTSPAVTTTMDDGIPIWFSIYVVGLILFCIKLMLDLVRLQRQSHAKRVEHFNGFKIYTVAGEISPFSFFNRIWISEIITGEDRKLIIRHECNHAMQKHSLDIIYYKLIEILAWFNPAVYLFRKELQLVHEVQADAFAKNENLSAYAELLVNATFNVSRISGLEHTFFQSSFTKYRLMQLTQTKPLHTWRKVLLVLPFIVLLGVINTQAQGKSNDSVQYVGPEVMPEFPGGTAALMQFLTANMVYPEIAKTNGIEGMVVIGFMISEKGTISDVQVKRSVHAALDEEAIRVVKSMPAWKPGTTGGKPVAVEMTLPLSFKLSE